MIAEKIKTVEATESVVHKVPVALAPNPEVPAAAVRRRFTAEYKLRILKQADTCSGLGELGKLLRREG
ncbi:MAG TPA: hypothetical protein VLH56_04905, partial [Dissulfurispiraceae bacterium]|nr:hypothetical protein [Dissulfurispiraceae bacterium]